MKDNFLNQLELGINKPWLVVNEFLALLTGIVTPLLLFWHHVECGTGAKFYGLPRILRHRQSKIKIGNNYENRNFLTANPLAIDHPTVLSTLEKKATIKIGNNVGISGGNICSAKSITIGDNTMIGSNCLIIDTDFHPLKSSKRRYSKTGVNAKPIVIGKNVFVGTRSIILRGVTIGDNSVVGAGSIVRKNIPANCIFVDGKIKPLKK